MRIKLPNRSNLIRIKKDRNSLVSLGMAVSLIALTLYPLTFPPKAHAAVTESWVRFDRLATGSAISGTACMETSASGTEGGVVIDFPSDWTISSTPGNWTVTTTNLPTSSDNTTAGTAWPGINTATAVNGVSVRFPSTDLSDGTFYCFHFAGASSTVGPAGNDKTGQLKTEGGSPWVENVAYATSVVSSGADQITVTASVSATMTFSLSGTSVDLGTLVTSGSPTSGSPITQSVATNARNGWVSWITSANAGLDSSSASDSIDSAAWASGASNLVDLSGTVGYGVDVNQGTGSPTIAAEYNGSGNTDNVGNLDTQFRQTAAGSSPTADDEVNYVVRAKASTTNAAASDYTDTLTVVAAGSF